MRARRSAASSVAAAGGLHPRPRPPWRPRRRNRRSKRSENGSLIEWTRSQPIRTAAEVRLEIPLLQTRRPFAYQALAEKAWNFNRLGLSAVATAKSLGMSDKAVLKAIEWFKRRRDPGVG